MPGLRVGIVGTGGVGIASAGAIVFQGLAGCLTLYDRSGERARGEALDYLHAMPLLPVGSAFRDELRSLTIQYLRHVDSRYFH